MKKSGGPAPWTPRRGGDIIRPAVYVCCRSVWVLGAGLLLAQGLFAGMDLMRIAIGLGVLLLSAAWHESAHALVADRLGDSTGRLLGRISLNPLRHIDPFMTVLLPLMLLVASGGRFVFGGARPVPINAANFRNPSLGLAISAAAGPVSNFVLAALAFSVLALCYAVSRDLVNPASISAFVFMQLILVNVLLGAFNLIPIPPLDGSRVLRHFVSAGVRALMDSMEGLGMVIICLLGWQGYAALFQVPFLRGAIAVLVYVFDPPYAHQLLTHWGL